MSSRPVRWFRRTGSEALGWILVPLGLILMPAPGPGTLVLVAGVALLAQHYSWARRILEPLQRSAIRAARQGVQTIPRILASAAGGLWLFAAGVVWGISPDIGTHQIAGLTIGPELPGAGWVTGVGLIVSAIAAWTLLIYSIIRWRGEPDAVTMPASDEAHPTATQER